ncbi:Hypothetical predicted protein [Paramuricea clavata]|uniref:Uncharacterized protein n=1 Tax=Paramuricea clavata TaxID=317549 RepID=A0A7D9K3W1_PARCT|nr:Hypothetical predicted protein [Paramuricea clavata]
MSSVFLILLVLSISLIVAEDECYTNSDCKSNFREFPVVCCKGNSRPSERTCRPYNCIGQYCITDGDCGGIGECCKDNRCLNYTSCQSCNSNSFCATSEYCCKRGGTINVCRRSCIAERCWNDADCGGPAEYCCKGVRICRKSCIGEPCKDDNQCGHSGVHCSSDRKCIKPEVDTSSTTLKTLNIVIGIMLPMVSVFPYIAV